MKATFLNGSDKARLIGKIILSLVSGFGGGFLLFYIFLPPLNFQSVGFWVYLLAVMALFIYPFLDLKIDNFVEITKRPNGSKRKRNVTDVKFNKLLILPLCIPIAVIVLGLLISSEIFNARSYASIITVEESDFSSDMPKKIADTLARLPDGKLIGIY